MGPIGIRQQRDIKVKTLALPEISSRSLASMCHVKNYRQSKLLERALFFDDIHEDWNEAVRGCFLLSRLAQLAEVVKDVADLIRAFPVVRMVLSLDQEVGENLDCVGVLESVEGGGQH